MLARRKPSRNIVSVFALTLVAAGMGLASCQRLTNGGPQAPVPSSVNDTPEPEREAPANTPTVIYVDALDLAPEAAGIARASSLLQRGDFPSASQTLSAVQTPAAQLLRARLHRQQGELDAAKGALEKAAADAALTSLVELERGLLALAQGNKTDAATLLLQPLQQDPALASLAVLPLFEVLPESQPKLFIQHADALAAALPKDNLDARSLFLDALARAQDADNQPSEAKKTRLRRYLEEPVSSLTPETPPAGAVVSHAEKLQRAARLLDAHRNERVMAELGKVADEDLSQPQRCEKAFSQGLASRKLRHYATAEEHLALAMEICEDEDLVRRAAYLHAKVVSIRSGLRAVPYIETFAKRFAGHSMVDDVLFWAGDLYQRRGRFGEAAVFYQRIGELEPKDDHCAEARWRLAWMQFRQQAWQKAQEGLMAMLRDDGCVTASFDRARALYWLGRVYGEQNQGEQAAEHFEKAIFEAPMSFYAQQALARLSETNPGKAKQLYAALKPPASQGEALGLCVDFLADSPAFEQGMEYLSRGLNDDAARAFESVALPEAEVFAGSHAAALGVEAKHAARASTAELLEACGPTQAHLLLALLLDKAGAKRESHWRLRTHFADILQELPSPRTLPVWHAAYPLAWRDEISAAEKEASLPNFFLQALAREESAFDPQAVSWAGAYGLTQLLVSTAQAAGKLASPRIRISQGEELLEPAVSARLGGLFLGSLQRRFGGHLGLVLAAYNAGDNVALTWWKRHQDDPFDVYAEEMTIRETRGYVARVLRTFGIYRWLYGQEAPLLPVDAQMPRRG